MQAINPLLAQAEQTLLDRVLPHLFGYYIVHCGQASMVHGPLESSPILQQYYVFHPQQIDLERPKPNLLADYHELPFKINCLDVVVFQHGLEYCVDPKLALQHVWHQLIPGGHLVVIGYNPRSLFGLWWRFSKKPKPGLQLLSLAYLRRQLTQLNYEIMQEHTDFFRPPLNQERYLNKLRFLEPVVATLCPSQGAVYLLVAKKQISAITPLKPVWARQFFATGLTSQNQPATQTLHYDATSD